MGVKKASKKKPLQNGYSFDPMAVTWTEKYSDSIEKVWNKLPDFVGKFIATVAIIVVGSSLKGEWIAIAVHIAKQYGYVGERAISNNATFKWSEISLESLRLQNLEYYWIGSCAVSYGMYIIIGGFLHWYFYVRQRDKAEEWKCQPHKWLSPELERHEIMLGSTTLLLNSTLAAVIACYVANDGEWSSVYYRYDLYGWWWFLLQFPLVFIYQDYATYWLHRIYHTPWLYKKFHKLHHKYKQPTAFSVTAIHPVESVHIQVTLCLPLFLLPIHWLPFYVVVMYSYYHGLIDHSGINFKAQWWQPWQPDAIFHDNHHQYFHVNFGFNISLWDKLHGTYRQKDRVYREDIFYGKGKSLNEVSPDELHADMEERLSENPLAYRENQLVYKLTRADLASSSPRRKKKNKGVN